MREIISDVYDSRHIFDYYDKHNDLRDDLRKLFVKHVVSVMCVANGSSYPTSDEKIEYAKMCVLLFPIFKSGSHCGGVSSSYIFKFV